MTSALFIKHNFEKQCLVADREVENDPVALAWHEIQGNDSRKAEETKLNEEIETSNKNQFFQSFFEKVYKGSSLEAKMDFAYLVILKVALQALVNFRIENGRDPNISETDQSYDRNLAYLQFLVKKFTKEFEKMSSRDPLVILKNSLEWEPVK